MNTEEKIKWIESALADYREAVEKAKIISAEIASKPTLKEEHLYWEIQERFQAGLCTYHYITRGGLNLNEEFPQLQQIITDSGGQIYYKKQKPWYMLSAAENIQQLENRIELLNKLKETL